MSNEYDFQSYLYPAGSAASGGGVGSGSGTGTASAPAKPIEVGAVTTGRPGTDAIVTVEDTPAATVLNFTIPRGSDGQSAYLMANGDMEFGSVDAWIASLKGAKGDKGDPGVKGDAGTVDAGTIKSALGSTIMQRMQALLPHFEAAFVAKPADLKNGEWYQVKFKQQFDDVDLDKPVVLVQPLLNDYRYFLVRNITAQGFEFKCPYTPDFLGLYYVKFATA